MPKPAAPTAEELRQQRNGQNGRRRDGGNGGGGRNGAGEGQAKRRFSRPKGAPGAHKGAVKRFGGGR
jgi:ATP-dependent RNA helicase RhlE